MSTTPKLTVAQILAALTKGEISQADAASLLAVGKPRKEKTAKDVTLEVSAKGALKFKGLRTRWPLVVYPNEMKIIFELKEMIEKFMEDNHDKLSFQPGDLEEPAGEEKAA